MVQYVLNLNSGILNKKSYDILREENSSYLPFGSGSIIYCFLNEKGQGCSIASYDLNCIKTNGFYNEVFVNCVDNGTNEIENYTLVKELLTDYINNRQLENEATYREKTIQNQNSINAIENMFKNEELDFLDSIKRQAKQCSELLSSCDNIDSIRKLGNWGYNDQEVMIDLDDNGLLPLNQAYKEHGLVDDYEVYRIQLESFENLGTVLYDFKKEKLYFSVYKDEEEYAIIEDTTLETLEEDYQDYLDRENNIGERAW